MLSNHRRRLISSPNRNTNHPDQQRPCQEYHMSTAPNRHTSLPHLLRQYDQSFVPKSDYSPYSPWKAYHLSFYQLWGTHHGHFQYCLSAARASLIRISIALDPVLSFGDIMDYFFNLTLPLRYFPFQTPSNSDSQVSLSFSPLKLDKKQEENHDLVPSHYMPATRQRSTLHWSEGD